MCQASNRDTPFKQSAGAFRDKAMGIQPAAPVATTRTDPSPSGEIGGISPSSVIGGTTAPASRSRTAGRTLLGQ